jgi:2C-methyl-D-erythritol 2,4-cyclodiphosphate synthase
MKIKIITIMLFLLSFVIGAIGGVFFGSYFFPSKGRFHRESSEEVRKRFYEQVKLNEYQAKQVDSIFASQKSRFDDIRRRHREEFVAHRDTLKMKIRKVLSPEQNALYDEFIRNEESKRNFPKIEK